MIVKWLNAVFSKHIVSVIKGNWMRLTGGNTRLYHIRRRSCMSCTERESVKGVGEICGICGCPLKSKLRVEDEKCGLNKW